MLKSSQYSLCEQKLGPGGPGPPLHEEAGAGGSWGGPRQGCSRPALPRPQRPQRWLLRQSPRRDSQLGFLSPQVLPSLFSFLPPSPGAELFSKAFN